MTASPDLAAGWWRDGGLQRELPPPVEAAAPLRPGTTVAICTYRRPRSLRRCLDSLSAALRDGDEVFVVDASDDADSEAVVQQWLEDAASPVSTRYCRVRGRLRGLTRQRNFALDRVRTDLVTFFDDDVVVSPGCLAAMEAEFRRAGEGLVGVGALITNELRPLDWQWRIRRALGAVSDLRPGSYHRSGVSVPWSPVRIESEPVRGDCLPGGATTWRTRAARAVRFDESLDGYAAGEDLDFSLRIRRTGMLLMHPGARVEHFPDARGRPEPERFGYMEIYNRFRIQGRGLEARSGRDIAWFAYAWTVDTLLLCRHFLLPARWVGTARQIRGRLRAAFDLARGRAAMQEAE